MVNNLGFGFTFLLLIGSYLFRIFSSSQTHHYMFACILLFIVGESSNHSGNGETEESAEKQDIISLEDSPKERGSTSSSGTDTANTPQTVVGANDKSLNDAMLNDTSVSDTSISSMSELSGNTSFHEASIAFSSTCIKAPSDMTLPSDSAVDLEEVANDSVAMKDV